MEITLDLKKNINHTEIKPSWPCSKIKAVGILDVSEADEASTTKAHTETYAERAYVGEGVSRSQGSTKSVRV